MKSYFYCLNDNTGLLIILQKDRLEQLLSEANKLEKQYEWLQATKSYNEASDLALKKQDSLKVSELQERLGFCFYKAADQAKTNKEFRKLIKQAADAYKKELEILKGAVVENKRIKITHAQALIAYVDAMLEKSSLKKKSPKFALVQKTEMITSK